MPDWGRASRGITPDRMRAVRCDECDGRSFSDPTREYHWPECSRYRAWRFPPKRVPGRLRWGVGGKTFTRFRCGHRFDGDWTACTTCTDAADFDDGKA